MHDLLHIIEQSKGSLTVSEARDGQCSTDLSYHGMLPSKARGHKESYWYLCISEQSNDLSRVANRLCFSEQSEILSTGCTYNSEQS